MTPEQLAHLQSIEWAGGVDSDGIASCPACQRKRYYHDDRRNHRADCWLADALRVALVERHDCEDWAMEGIGCANCNPIAVEIYKTQQGERTCATCHHSERLVMKPGHAQRMWCHIYSDQRDPSDGCIKGWTPKEETR